jgi:hypothetical protein
MLEHSKQRHTRPYQSTDHSTPPCSLHRSWLSSILPVWPSCPKTQPLLAPLVIVSPPRHIRKHQVPTESVTGPSTAIQGVTGSKNIATDGDVTVGVAVIATKAVTEVVVKAATAAMEIVTTTGEMKVLRTVAQGEVGLSGMIALPSGLHVHHLGLLLGVQVPNTMTTLDEILLHHHHPTTTAPDGQISHLRTTLLGVSKKTCTEGMVGLTEGVTISNGKWASCIACQRPS